MGVINVYKGDFIDSYSVYRNNRAKQGGAYYFKDANANISHILAINNSAEYGGAIQSEDSTNFNAESSTFINNYATQAGGTISVIRSTLVRTLNTVILSNCVITGSFSEFQGGTLYLENDGITATF